MACFISVADVVVQELECHVLVVNVEAFGTQQTLHQATLGVAPLHQRQTLDHNRVEHVSLEQASRMLDLGRQQLAETQLHPYSQAGAFRQRRTHEDRHARKPAVAQWNHVHTIVCHHPLL